MSPGPASNTPADEHAPPATPGSGLHAPEGPVLGDLEPLRRRSRTRLAINGALFLACLALLGWVISIALSEENRAQFERLRAEGLGPVAIVAALAALSVVVNGAIFWTTSIPVAKLRGIEVVAVNAVATMLAYLPFKIGLLARIAVHRVRDGMTYRDLLAWLAASAAIALAVLGVLALTTVWRTEVDALWWIVFLGGSALAGAGGVLAARLVERSKALNSLTLGAARIGRRPGVVATAQGLRVVDILLQSARFGVAATALGYDITLNDAVLLGTTFFVAGVFSPAGMFGPREGAVIGVGVITERLGMTDNALAVLALVVSAVECAVQVGLGLVGAAALRLDRMILSPGAGQRASMVSETS